MSVITVSPVSSDITLQFAAEELVRYLVLMGNQAQRCENVGVLFLGTYSMLNLQKPEHELDDGYIIKINTSGAGCIGGTNPRSVLMGVYRYLVQCGCRFLYPGDGGEIIPRAQAVACDLQEVPSYRHRCICIEGANALKNILDVIDWLPKAGMNSYHLQLKDGYVFFERWYSHTYNPLKSKIPITSDETRRFITDIREAIGKRGLIMQYMGHGWTCESLGIPALGWGKQDYDISDDTSQLLAKVNGKRNLWFGVPVNTNLCLSNPVARGKMVDYIVNFCMENPDADYVHVWLADDENNYCECEICKEKRPSDWYMLLLNELDVELTLRKLPTRIIFLVYSETLWKPQEYFVKNPDRFTMIFAPVSMDYTKSFVAKEPLPELRPFVLNNLHMPQNAAENIAYLKDWKTIFRGDSFIFFYHLLSCGWDKDLTCYRLARVIHDDIVRLKDIGLNGASACQAQRVCFPTGLCMYVQARTLWDKDLSFEDLVQEYFSAAYGEKWENALKILQFVSDIVKPKWLLQAVPRVNSEQEKMFRALDLNSAELFCHECAESHTKSEAINWRYLEIFCNLVSHLKDLFIADAAGDDNAARQSWNKFLPELFSYEDELQTVFDMEWFARNFELFLVKGFKHFVNHEKGD